MKCKLCVDLGSQGAAPYIQPDADMLTHLAHRDGARPHARHAGLGRVREEVLGKALRQGPPEVRDVDGHALDLCGGV